MLVARIRDRLRSQVIGLLGLMEVLVAIVGLGAKRLKEDYLRKKRVFKKEKYPVDYF